jgi:hypothetical protein
MSTSSQPDPESIKRMTMADPELLFRSFLNEREATGRTALFIGVEVNRPKCVETLLAFRADPNLPNSNGITPLQLACEKGFQTCIRVLVRNQASCQVSKGKSLVELIWASVPNLDERAELFAYLVANGAPIEDKRMQELIQQVPPESRNIFVKAVAEARVILARTKPGINGGINSPDKKAINAPESMEDGQ